MALLDLAQGAEVCLTIADLMKLYGPVFAGLATPVAIVARYFVKRASSEDARAERSISALEKLADDPDRGRRLSR